MDEFTKKHLSAWLDGQFTHRVDDRNTAESAMIALVTEYPEILLTHTWTEILMLALRK